MAIKLQIFMIKKFPKLDSNQTLTFWQQLALILLLRKMTVIICKFLKEQEKVIKHIRDNLGDFSYSSDKFDEE